VLVVALRGRVGNDILDVYDHCAALILAGLEGWQPMAAVLDFTDLEYSWGDLMGNVLLTPERWFGGEGRRTLATIFGEPPLLPMAVVTSALCHDGLSSLIADEMLSDVPLYGDLAGALTRVDAELAALRDRGGSA
jgi:hypothetical protein